MLTSAATNWFGALGRLALISAIPIIFFSVGLFNLRDYGETNDEKFDQYIGEFYYYYWGTPDHRDLDSINNHFIELQRNYGPLFDTIVVAAQDWLHNKSGLISDAEAAYHLPVLAASSLLLVVVSLWGLALWGKRVALISCLALALLPRFIGDSQNNLKDTPLALFFSLTLLLFYWAVEKRKTWIWVLAGFAMGASYCVKINALLVAPIICIWLLCSGRLRRRNWGYLMFGGLLALPAFLIAILIFWPYYRYDMVSRFQETLRIFGNHEWNEYVLYLGEHIRGQEMPWHYPFVMFGVTTPVGYLLAAGLSLVVLLRTWRLGSKERDALLLTALWGFLPLIVQASSSAPMYDGVRHYIYSFPAFALLVGTGVSKSLRWCEFCLPRGKWIGSTFVALYFSMLLLKDILIHPYQIVYFNQLVGGVKGAYGKFDLDYWGQSYREAAEWLNKSLPPQSTLLVRFGSHQLPYDSNRIQITSNSEAWPDYKLILIRGMMKELDTTEDYLNPTRQPIYKINVEGADILRVFELQENWVTPSNQIIEPLPPLPENAATPPKSTYSRSEFSNGSFETQIGESKMVPSIGFDCPGGEFTNKPTALRYLGSLKIQTPGTYCFWINSDDQSRLLLNDRLVVKAPTLAPAQHQVQLLKGRYNLQLDYVNTGGPACLQLKYNFGSCN